MRPPPPLPSPDGGGLDADAQTWRNQLHHFYVFTLRRSYVVTLRSGFSLTLRNASPSLSATRSVFFVGESEAVAEHAGEPLHMRLL